MAPYERFEAFQLCHQLALAVYRETAAFPKHEQYGLFAQARRAAFSAPAQYRRRFRRFLDIALGSLAELGYAIRFAHELGFLDSDHRAALDEAHTRASKATWVLYASMTGK
jgi:four helix bundle protein